MGDQVILLLIGFILTSVVGGFLGYWFQTRAWRREAYARLWQSEGDAARAVFEELSRMLDRRLHRMRELDARLSRPGESGEMRRSLERYREAVDEWNDNVNRILALAQRYFGQKTRDYLDNELMRRFVEAGRRLEARVREYDSEEPLHPSIAAELTSLGARVYELNVDLISAIQQGEVGVLSPWVGGKGSV